MTSDAPDIHTLSGAYALGALDADEAAAFEGHLESCASCRDEVRSFTDATSSLADVVATPAPDRLRTSVLAGISDVRPLPPVVPTDRDPDAVAASPDDEDDELAARRRERSRRSSRWLAVAAAVLAVVAVGAVWRSVALTAQVDSITASAADVSSVITAPDATTVTGSVSTGGRAAVVTSKQRGQAVLVADGLAPAPVGQTYQIWFLDSSGAATSAGFVPAGGNSAVLLQGDPGTAAAVGVTLEPAGGSTQPTTTPVLAVQV
jgi:anti-sigma-K factor RskA